MEPNSAADSAVKTLTPAEVHNIAFKKPPIGKRGYDEEEVDYFLDIVETEMSRLIEANEALRNGAGSSSLDGSTVEHPDQHLVEENQRLTALVAEYEQQGSEVQSDNGLSESLQSAQQQVEELQRQLEATRQQASDSQRAAEQARAEAAEVQRNAQEAIARAEDEVKAAGDSSQQAVKVLMLAQQTADQHVSVAQAEADRLLTDARVTAEQLDSESTNEAERRVTEAQQQADTLKRDSEAQAAKVVQDAEAHAASVVGTLGARTAALEERIEELSTFEREYRSRLKSYLESQLRDLMQGTDVEAAETR